MDLKERWVLSYDAGPDVEDLYGAVANKVYLHVPYSTGTARTARREVRTEAIIAHRRVTLPLGIDRPGHRGKAGLQSVRKPTFHYIARPPAKSELTASGGQTSATGFDTRPPQQLSSEAVLLGKEE